MSAKPQLIAVVAMTPERVIGKDGKMPWHMPEDLKLFKKLTMGHPILMGRKTFESIGRPLPGRQNIVLTRQSDWSAEGVDVIHDVADIAVLDLMDEQVMLIGGGELYAMMLQHCDALFVSEIQQSYEGDTYFPEFKQLFPQRDIVEHYDGFQLVRYAKLENK